MMKKIFFLTCFLMLISGCDKTNSMECVDVNNQKVCFQRAITGRESESLTLTTNNDVCHKPSKENDYTVSGLTSFEEIDYKIENNKLYVYAVPIFDGKRKSKFPVEVIFIPYDPLKSEQELRAEGFQKLNLGYEQMTWCIF